MKDLDDFHAQEDKVTSKARGVDRILGRLRLANGKGVVRMEDRFDTDVGNLWSALSDPRRLARWIGEVDGDLRVGGDFHARFFDGWEGTVRVEACDPPKRLLLSMRDANPQPGQPGETVIEAWLTKDGARAILVAEERSLPPDLLAAYWAGVQCHFENLAAHITGRERAEGEARWEELFPAYQELAASIGQG